MTLALSLCWIVRGAKGCCYYIDLIMYSIVWCTSGTNRTVSMLKTTVSVLLKFPHIAYSVVLYFHSQKFFVVF